MRGESGRILSDTPCAPAEQIEFKMHECFRRWDQTQLALTMYIEMRFIHFLKRCPRNLIHLLSLSPDYKFFDH